MSAEASESTPALREVREVLGPLGSGFLPGSEVTEGVAFFFPLSVFPAASSLSVELLVPFTGIDGGRLLGDPLLLAPLSFESLSLIFGDSFQGIFCRH